MGISLPSVMWKIAIASFALSAGFALAEGKVVEVDCSKGQSINAELEKNTGSDLIIQIKGICIEDVVVRRDRVTLRGTDPSTDGISAATSDPAVDEFGIALHVQGAGRFRAENLKLTGGSLAGFMATNANQRPQIEVVNCRMEGNGQIGAFLVNSRVLFTDSAFTGNGPADLSRRGAGLVSSEASLAICDGCMIKDNPVAGEGTALAVQLQSSASISASQLSGFNGVNATSNSQVSLDETSIQASNISLNANHSTTISMFGSTLEGPFGASNKSNLELFGVVQAPLAEGDFNLAQHDSYIRLRGLAEDPGDPPALSQIGPIFFFGFSNGHFRSSTIAELTCQDESEASCPGSVTITGASTCGACPPPPE